MNSAALVLCINTGKPMDACIDALEQCGGDFAAAIEYLKNGGHVQLIDRVRKLEALVAKLQLEIDQMKDDNR